MLILRIRQAECALTDGRLDEAFELAQADDVRGHRRGQELTGRVVRAFVRRGGDHLVALRFTEAMDDCRKAARLAGSTAEIAHLRAEIARAMVARQHLDQEQGRLIATARRRIDDGEFSMGQRLLDEAAEQTGRVGTLKQEAALRRDALDSACGKVQAAIDRDDWSKAIEELLSARKQKLTGVRLSELAGHLTKLVLGRIRVNIAGGRLDLADNQMRRLQPLAGEQVDAQELAKVLRYCHQAARLIERGRVQQAGRIFRRLSSILPDVAWVDQAVRDCRSATEALEMLTAGPVGLLCPEDAEGLDLTSHEKFEDVSVGERRQELVEEVPAAQALPEKFLIQADGVGSFLVVRGDAVTVGPISSAERPQVGLLADPSLPVATIERTDQDYFLRCERPVMVNEKPTTEKLLVDGDRIALAPRCRWRFLRPNAASGTAVMAMSGARLPQADTRKVILLDREIVIGPGPTAHIRVDQCEQGAVLHVRDGRLLCRSDMPALVGGRPIGPDDAIPMDAPVQIGPISLVFKAV